MKKSLVFLFALFSFAACDLTKLEPAQTKSFMKYFGDVGKTYGEDVLQLEDGYLLLGNNYSGDDKSNHEYSVLIKTDLNGNTLWTQFHQDIEGRSLARTTDGYFIVGDGTNSTNSTMMLIKTDLQGALARSAPPIPVGATESWHGTAIHISSANEVIISGYIEQAAGVDEIFIYGYPIDLDSSEWDNVARLARENARSSRSIGEAESNEPGNPFFVSTTLYNTGTGNTLQAYSIRKNELTPGPSSNLLSEFELIGEVGQLSISATSAVVQSAINEGNSAIVFAPFDPNSAELSPVIISPPNVDGEESFDYSVNSFVRTSDNNYVVLGSTNNTGGELARTDIDYFVKKVGFDGSDINDGFTLMFGGLADEYGTKIIEADDGGYVFIGTHESENDIDFMVLVKLTKDGKLIN